jgi:hypothetical protein
MMRLVASSTLVAALMLSPALAADDGDPSAERVVRGEHSLPRQLLGAPYAIVAITAWPVKHFLFFMEDVNLPARVIDAVTFPVRAFRGEEE